MKSFELSPVGLLFFRDARPLDQDKTLEEFRNVGHGGYWPRPDHLYNAVMHSLINSRDCPEKAYKQFGGVQVIGPFPELNGVTYFPRPLDWNMRIRKCGDTDLPAFLTHGFLDRVEGKKIRPAWISQDKLQTYLKKSSLEEFSDAENPLYDVEPHIGTTLDAETGASKRVEGKQSGQYHAEYLRLGKDVTMVCQIETGRSVELPGKMIMGGQGGVVSVNSSRWKLEEIFPAPNPMRGKGHLYLRWTLLAPACFSQTGWLPGWCKDSRKDIPDNQKEPDGAVMFPDCKGAKLIAACTGKPICFSGWDTETGPKATVLVVPAGSVYLFDCPDVEIAKALTGRLHLQRCSDFGSQGFGIGICSFVEI